MNIRQLEYFVAVADNLSFTKAAEKFFISQTGVTQQVKALEEQMNVTLLKRDKRHVELTPAGKVFLSDARAIINYTNQAVAKAQQVSKGFNGTLSIGIISGYECGVLADHLRNFTFSYPNVSLEIRRDGMSELLHSLDEQLLDVAYVINPEQQKLQGYRYQPIGHYSLVALLPPGHPLSNRTTIELKELSHDNFIFVKETSDEHGQKSMVQNRYREAGFVPNIVQRCNDFHTILLMVSANLGVSVLPSFAIASPEVVGNVAVVSLEGDQDRIEVVAAWNPENHNPALERFLKSLS